MGFLPEYDDTELSTPFAPLHLKAMKEGGDHTIILTLVCTKTHPVQIPFVLRLSFFWLDEAYETLVSQPCADDVASHRAGFE